MENAVLIPKEQPILTPSLSKVVEEFVAPGVIDCDQFGPTPIPSGLEHWYPWCTGGLKPQTEQERWWCHFVRL